MVISDVLLGPNSDQRVAITNVTLWAPYNLSDI